MRYSRRSGLHRSVRRAPLSICRHSSAWVSRGTACHARSACGAPWPN